jgi:hypothetical protein
VPTLTEHLIAASDRGFSVEHIEPLTQQLRELTRLIGREQYRAAQVLADVMGAECGFISARCARFADR